MKPDCGIYKITNIDTGAIYIGQSAYLTKRRKQHIGDLERGIHDNERLLNSYNKHGKDKFVFDILLFCEKHELTYYEQKLVDQLQPFYNICRVCVNSRLGTKLSDISIKRNSLGHMGQIPYNKGVKGIVKKSDEAKQKLSEALKGHTTSPETRMKISESNKGQVRSEETRKNISQSHMGIPSWNKGKKATEEARRHQSEAQILYWKNKRLETKTMV